MPVRAVSEAESLVATGLAYQREGNLVRAEQCYRESLLRQPRGADAYHLLGCLYGQLGRADEAVALIEKAISIDRKAPAYYYNLANILLQTGKNADAAQHYRKALRLKPDYPAACNNLGLALSGSNPAQAIAAFRSALRLRPDFFDAHFNLGNVLKAEQRLDEAIECYRLALSGSPSRAQDIYFNLGNALAAKGRLDEAVTAYTRALGFGAAADLHTNLGAAYLKQGKQDLAIHSYREAMRLNPQDAIAHSALVTALSYATDDPQVVLDACTSWQTAHVPSPHRPTGGFANSPDPARRLRIGYVSPDFRRHAVSYFAIPLLEGHDRRRVEIYCYSDVARPDEVTCHIRGCADHWVDCSALTDDALAARIRDDGIDILVDLAGHTAHNRLKLFATKPVPVQVGWFGFPATTGLMAMDYRLSDSIMDPVGESETHYTEDLIRLPRFYASFRPDPASPPVYELPALRKGFVTFASINNFAKVTPATLELWAEILRRVPSSRLLLKAAGLDDAARGEEIRAFFASRDVEAARLDLQGESPLDEFLALSAEIDIVLDTYPFNGGVTTCHALWMGLPVVTLAGRSAASRVGKSIMTAIGMPEVAADSPDAYCAAAVALASDVNRIADMRRTMRERLVQSRLLDGADLAGEVERAYRLIWTRWCETEGRAGQGAALVGEEGSV